jgi:hypothetical protein
VDDDTAVLFSMVDRMVRAARLGVKDIPTPRKRPNWNVKIDRQ